MADSIKYVVDSKGNIYKNNIFVPASNYKYIPESVKQEAHKAKNGQPYTQVIETGGSSSNNATNNAPKVDWTNPLGGVQAVPSHQVATPEINGDGTSFGATDSGFSFFGSGVGQRVDYAMQSGFGVLQYALNFLSQYARPILTILFLGALGKVFNLRLKWK